MDTTFCESIAVYHAYMICKRPCIFRTQSPDLENQDPSIHLTSLSFPLSSSQRTTSSTSSNCSIQRPSRKPSKGPNCQGLVRWCGATINYFQTPVTVDSYVVRLRERLIWYTVYTVRWRAFPSRTGGGVSRVAAGILQYSLH